MEQHARPSQGRLDESPVQKVRNLRRSGYDADLLQPGHVREGRDQAAANQFSRVPDGLRKAQTGGFYTYHVERWLPEHARQRSLQLRLCQQCGGTRAGLEEEDV